MNKNYQEFHKEMREIADLHGIWSLLEWDSITQLPKWSSDGRGRQVALISGIAHEKATRESFGALLRTLTTATDLSESEKRNVAEARHNYEKDSKLPKEFVEELAETTSRGELIWEEAKKASDFSLFEPVLQKIIDLKRKEIELLWYTDHPYNALLDGFEPHATMKDIDPIFADVKARLVPFVQKILQKPKRTYDFLSLTYDEKKQWEFINILLRQIGFDFNHGRLDKSAHPCTCSATPEDVRLTTRINTTNIMDGSLSAVHEAGHGLYDQGLRPEAYWLAEWSATSMGIHESQSRFWEIFIAQGRDYWIKNYPLLQSLFPENLSGVSLDDFYASINQVQNSLIRIEADELTYHLHILIRYELEKAIFEGKLEAKDLPKAWNEKYKEYLWVDVPGDAHGVLQDVHWGCGLFWYFPTYSLGSVFAAQLFATVKRQIPNFTTLVQTGDFAPILSWLRENIHQHGWLYTAQELCIRATGESLNFEYFMTYAREKYSEIYNLS